MPSKFEGNLYFAKVSNIEMFQYYLNLKHITKFQYIFVFRICLGPLADVWMYVMKHIKNESTVQTIKGNLRLNSKTQIDVCKLLR